MRGKIVEETVFTCWNDRERGIGRLIRRIVVDCPDKLTITSFHRQLFVFTGFVFTSSCRIVGEVEVPDELVENARSFIRAKEEFNCLREKFEGLVR